MASYSSFMVTTRTFQVEDSDAFEKELQKFGVVEGNWDGGLTYTREQGEFWFGGYDADIDVWSEEAGERIDLIPIIQKHMRSGTLWKMQHVGYEKLRYVTGYALVVSKFNSKVMDLDQAERQLETRMLVANHLKVRLLNDSDYTQLTLDGLLLPKTPEQ